VSFSIDRLLAPNTLQAFRDSHYESQPFLIQRTSPHYYDELITIEAVSEHLGQAKLSSTDIRLVKEGDEMASREFTYPARSAFDGLVNQETLFARFYDGSTMILNAFERHCAKMFHFTQTVERAFHATVQANLYLTPRESRGFGPHWDDHDVFVLQFNGAKEWSIYDSPDVLTTRNRLFKEEDYASVEPSLRVVLERGDLLYVPRGFVHRARSLSEISAHVTVGIFTFKYAELLRRMLDDPESHAWLRRSLPVCIDPDEFPVEEFLAHVRAFLATTDVRKALARLRDQYAGSRMPDATRRLMDYAELPALDRTTRVRTRRSFHEFAVEDSFIVLKLNNRPIRFPLEAEESLRSIDDLEEFEVHSLPGDLDDAGKVDLCATLVREGFLTIVEGDATRRKA